MKPDDAYKGVLKIGDDVRHIQTGRRLKITDIITANVKGDKVMVEVLPDLYYDIEELEKI